MVGMRKKQKTWEELATRNIKSINEMPTLEVEGIIRGIRISAKQKKRNTVMTAYGNNTAIPSFAKIKELSMMMRNEKSLTT